MPTPGKLHHDRPDFTSALRTLTWRYLLDGEALTAGQIERAVKVAREDLGLPAHEGGAVSTYRQQRTAGLKAHQDAGKPLHYEPDGTRFVPAGAVRANWRFLDAPAHPDIRVTAAQGLLHVREDELRFSTRASHLPSLVLVTGSLDEVRARVKQAYATRRGLYLLRREGKNYVGQTGEFETRGRAHQARGADRVLFAFPDETPDVTRDELDVAESLTIVVTSELFQTRNLNLGSDRRAGPDITRRGSACPLRLPPRSSAGRTITRTMRHTSWCGEPTSGTCRPATSRWMCTHQSHDEVPLTHRWDGLPQTPCTPLAPRLT